MQVDESCAQSEQVQDADSKVHFVSDPTRRLVCDHRSKGFILSHPDFTRHRKLLRFAFGGKACQHCVLPFGLALAPQTFTKSMDAALAPIVAPGHPNLKLSGRLISSYPGSGPDTSGLSARSLKEPRASDEPTKECSATKSATTFLW